MHDISYANLCMLMATVPDYSLDDDKEEDPEKEAEVVKTESVKGWFTL